MNRRYVDVVLASVLIVVAILILTQDGYVEGGVETELGSLFLPRVVAGFILLFSAMIGIPALRRIRVNAPLDREEFIITDGLGGVVLYVAIFFAYWWAVPVVGFLVATPFVMFAIAVLLRGRDWVAMIAMSIITPLIIFYACRDLIRVYLPEWPF